MKSVFCCTCGEASTAPLTLDGCHFCSVACRTEYTAYIAAELVRAREAFHNRTPQQRARHAEYNLWATQISDTPRAIPASTV